MNTQMKISHRSSDPIKHRDPDFWYWVIIGLAFSYFLIRFIVV